MKTSNALGKNFAGLLLGVFLLPLPASALTKADMDGFFKGLSKKVDLSRAHISLVDLRDAANPVRGGYEDTDITPAASVLKLALMAEAYRAQAEDGVYFDTPIKIEKKNYTGTWFPPNDPYPSMKPGAVWKFGDVVQVMVRRSDNVATNTLIDFLGRKKTTSYMAQLGLENTLIGRKLYSEIYVEDPESVSGNTMPPRDAATLLSLVAAEKLISPGASQAMYAALAGQMDRDLIAAALPPEAVYAGKTGQLSRNRNDAAIVKGGGRFYVLVIYMELPDEDAIPYIHAITKEADAFLSR